VVVAAFRPAPAPPPGPALSLPNGSRLTVVSLTPTNSAISETSSHARGRFAEANLRITRMCQTWRWRFAMARFSSGD